MPKPPILYSAFKAYVRFLVEKVYYRRTYYLNQNNIPAADTPLLIASNHQNSMNDAIGVLMSMKDRIVHFIVRADVFALSPIADKFLRAIGLLPAFRMNWEGEQALSNNGATFRDSERSIIDGNTVVIYPEAGHQDKHWLGTFSYGYTKMAFDAAEMGGFEKEVFVLPCCNHYSHYKGLRNDMLIKYGTPISLKPYYELYKTKPRTAQREVNALVREQIRGMMLNVEDVENYEAIDNIRQGAYGSRYAVALGMNPDELPEKLESDKKLVEALAKAKEADPENVSLIYGEAVKLYDDIKAQGLTETEVNAKPKILDLAIEAVVLVVLLPLAVFSLWPSVFSWFIPKHFADKAEDKMFQGTFVIALNALFIFPVLGLITLIFAWIKYGFIIALIYVLLFPALCLFEWAYAGWIKELVRGVKALKADKSGKLNELKDRQKKLFGALDNAVALTGASAEDK